MVLMLGQFVQIYPTETTTNRLTAQSHLAQSQLIIAQSNLLSILLLPRPVEVAHLDRSPVILVHQVATIRGMIVQPPIQGGRMALTTETTSPMGHRAQTNILDRQRMKVPLIRDRPMHQAALTSLATRMLEMPIVAMGMETLVVMPPTTVATVMGTGVEAIMKMGMAMGTLMGTVMETETLIAMEVLMVVLV
jgi:hypothetical protein